MFVRISREQKEVRRIVDLGSLYAVKPPTSDFLQTVDYAKNQNFCMKLFATVHNFHIGQRLSIWSDIGKSKIRCFTVPLAPHHVNKSCILLFYWCRCWCGMVQPENSHDVTLPRKGSWQIGGTVMVRLASPIWALLVDHFRFKRSCTLPSDLPLVIEYWFNDYWFFNTFANCLVQLRN